LEGFGPGLLDLCVLMPTRQQTIPADQRTFDPGSSTRFASCITVSNTFRPIIS
jgi:hypothetical protein